MHPFCGDNSSIQAVLIIVFCLPQDRCDKKHPLEAVMTNSNLLKTGIIGTVITALCCFTPLLVVLLGAVGLSAILGYLDIVLLPALGIFIILTLYALWKRQTA